ncbi:MAG: ABC transporter ATP-binding protein [Candidatus Rokuibacteriota bacterium]|nr:MAG: ABC transporter ATP-binding protein [Candidatus Rokubacteria bacterium]
MRAAQERRGRVRQGAGGESAVPDLQRVRARPQRLRARDPAVLGAPGVTEVAGAPNGWLLQTRDLTKRFGGLVAVDGLPLALRPGEVRGLIGPNGSGKTTTVNLLSGLYHADGGEIRLRGERIDRLRPHQIAARGVARTFQTPKLFGSMTTLENVLLPALAAQDRGDRRAMSEVRDRARRLLELVTLDGRRHAPAKELSGGQSMLLQIARGLMVRPIHLFLMDEPFAGVHPTIKDTIMETILRMNQEEAVTFLIVSHEMTTLRRLCRRVSVMHEGKLIAEGSFEEIAGHAAVLEAYLGR